MDLFGQPLEPYRPAPSKAESADMFEGHEIRRVDKDGRRWWVLADVCKVIGITNPAQASERLNDDEKGLCSTDTLGGKQSLTVVNEAGLYHVVLTTRLRKENPAYEKVNRFRRWVCHEVLPEIRKTGSYSGKKPLDKVARIQKRLNCDRKTAIEREKSIGQSKASHRLLMKLNATPNDYKVHNNNIYVRMYSLTARQLRKLLGLKPWQSPMDRMSHFTLSQLSHAKALGDKIAEFQNVKDLGKRNEIIGECVSYVRDSDLSRLGAPGQCVLGIREDDRRGKVLDVLLRPLAS